jgi:hypothetical protein
MKANTFRNIGAAHFVIPALAAAAMALPYGSAHAGSCDSAAKVLSDIWPEYDKVVNVAGCTIVTVASNGTVPPNACLDVATKVADITENMISFWNKMVNNNWATIGPRRLDYGTTLTGTVVSKGERMFVAALPTDKDKVDLKIKKTDGKAETDVTVCKDYRGTKTPVWAFTIPNGDDNVGQVWSRSLTGLKARELTVHFGGNSVTNSMSYELTATKQ